MVGCQPLVSITASITLLALSPSCCKLITKRDPSELCKNNYWLRPLYLLQVVVITRCYFNARLFNLYYMTDICLLKSAYMIADRFRYNVLCHCHSKHSVCQGRNNDEYFPLTKMQYFCSSKSILFRNNQNKKCLQKEDWS